MTSRANLSPADRLAVSRAMHFALNGRLIQGVTVSQVKPRGEWVASASSVHRFNWVIAVFTDHGTFYGGRAMCGLQIKSARLFVEPPDMDLCDECLFANEHVVYRYFDINDRLVYVGYTNSLIRRMNDHRRQAQWWPLVYRAAYELFPSEGTARDAETLAIDTESPLANIPTGSVERRRQHVIAVAERLTQLTT